MHSVDEHDAKSGLVVRWLDTTRSDSKLAVRVLVVCVCFAGKFGHRRGTIVCERRLAM